MNQKDAEKFLDGLRETIPTMDSRHEAIALIMLKACEQMGIPLPDISTIGIVVHKCAEYKAVHILGNPSDSVN